MNQITETGLEKGVYAAFAAWLAFYFDGGSHAVGSTLGLVFPKASLGFGQAPLPQPLNPVAPAAQNPTAAAAQVGITMTFGADTGHGQRRWKNVGGTRQQMFYRPVRWNFWLRSASADDAARAACLTASDLLESILANPAATRPLAQCGIHRIRPAGAQPVADNAFILRLLTCRATLRYAVLSQGGTLSLPVTTTTPGQQPTVRLTAAGVFELFDTGLNAYVPLVSEGGDLGTGAPDNS